MSAHTPAPWVIEADSGMSASYHMRRAVITSAEHEANARLIAAAPELLLQLIKICRVFPTDSDMDRAGWSGSDIEDACAAYDAARAAIAKAGGFA